MHIIYDAYTTVRKYYKPASNSVYIILLKSKDLFFFLIALNMSSFIKKKSTAEAKSHPCFSIDH